MKAAIMQPYFFPYIGYFDLINKSDCWIVFDVVRYKSRTWMNRNRILHPSEGWQYVSVPVEKNRESGLICDTSVLALEDSRLRILGQIEHYRRHAPYFANVLSLVNNTFSACKSGLLRDINIASMATVCEYIGIPFSYKICSQMALDFSCVKHAGQWALEICLQIGADSYINPPAGRSIFREDEWKEKGIKLEINPASDFEYVTSPYGFEPRLSVLDVLMWQSPSAIKKWLQYSKEYITPVDLGYSLRGLVE